MLGALVLVVMALPGAAVAVPGTVVGKSVVYLHQGLIFFCLIFLSATSALSTEAKISDLVISDSRGELLVDFRIENFFTEEMQAAVLKGIPITISFSISLYEVLGFWFDNKLFEKRRTITTMGQIRAV